MGKLIYRSGLGRISIGSDTDTQLWVVFTPDLPTIVTREELVSGTPDGSGDDAADSSVSFWIVLSFWE